MKPYPLSCPSRLRSACETVFRQKIPEGGYFSFVKNWPLIKISTVCHIKNEKIKRVGKQIYIRHKDSRKIEFTD